MPITTTSAGDAGGEREARGAGDDGVVVPLVTALRLAGFLTEEPSARRVQEAKERMLEALGSAAPASDAEAAARLAPILRRRGLAIADGSAVEPRAIAAGALASEGSADGLTVQLQVVSLIGQYGDPIGEARVTARGQFVLGFAPQPGRLLSLQIVRGATILYRSEPRACQGEMWFEWSAAGEPVSAPGRFEIREAYLDTLLARERLSLAELRPEHLEIVAGLSALSGLPREVVRQHVVAALLARELGVSAGVTSALLGPPVPHGEPRVDLARAYFHDLVATRPAPQLHASPVAEIDAVKQSVLAQISHDPASRIRAAVAARELPSSVHHGLPQIATLAAIAAPADAAADPAPEDAGRALLVRRAPRLSEAAHAFTRAHGDTIDLLRKPLHDLMFDPTGAAKPDLLPETRDELLALQRTARLAQDAATADALLDAGYTSALQIAFTERSQLVADLARVGVSQDTAERLHRRARTRYRATVETYLRLDRNAAGPPLPALASVAPSARDASVTPAVPSYAYLFGSQDFGPVDAWESVTGQASYLVDLLVWLSRAPRLPNVLHPYDVLVARRPDLTQVLLDRPNTETIIPHLDLVCELLEDAAAVRLGVATDGTALQTTLSAAEIRAYPEHVNTRVYDALQTKASAMSLPFDLALAEVRAYLALATVGGKPITRAELAAQLATTPFPPTGAPDQAAKDLAAEILGLNQTDFDLITTARPAQPDQQAIWGQAPISNVGAFLRRAPSPSRPREHLSYNDSLVLLSTRFVNPTGAIRIRLADGITVDHCRADERVFDPPLGTPTAPDLACEVLDRIHRLLRLARRVPASFVELDALIAAGGGKLDAPCLVAIAGLVQHTARLGLSFEETAALFRPFAESDVALLRPDGTRSLYRKLFLLRNDGAPIPDAYLTSTAAPLPLAGERARICAALEVAPDDHATLLQLAGLANGNVSFANLWQLFRYARLAAAAARTSKRSLADLAGLIGVLGDPFASIAALGRFQHALALLDAARLSAPDARRLAGVDPLAVPPAAALDAVLATLRSATQADLVARGLAADADAVDHAIVATGSWAAPFASWLDLDPRLTPALRIFDDATVLAMLAVSPARDAALRKIALLAALLVALRVTASEVSFVVKIPGLRDALGTPSWDWLSAVLDVFALARDGANQDAFVAYVGRPAPATLAGAASNLAVSFGLDAARVTAAWRALDPADPPTAARDAAFLARVRALAQISTSVGVMPDVVVRWATAWPAMTDAHAVRNAVRSTLTAPEWLDRSTKIQDSLREAKRDALIDYIVAVPRPGATDPMVPEPTDPAGFSARFLIDVEMGACRDTSRIVQAASTIQLLVQRCLIGLEPAIVPNFADASASQFWLQWEWRKRYRLWQANREIFLYPENFLSIGNRADASPLFAELQKQLSQTEVTEETVSSALETYLSGLEQIARLDYQAVDTFTQPGGSPILGVLACSAGTPPAYYYRKLLGGVWSPWEEVALGPSTTSPALAQGLSRAWVVWPTSTDHIMPDQGIPAAQASSTPLTLAANGGRGLTYVRYSWSLRDDRGVWSAVKSTSRSVLMSPRDRRSLVLAVSPDSPSPGVFNVVLLSPDPDKPSDTVAWTSAMSVARDATGSFVHPRMSFGTTVEGSTSGVYTPTAEPKWREHYTEYRLSSELTVVAQLDAWTGFHFDGNRMVAGTGTTDVSLVLPVGTTLLAARAPLAITRPRGYVQTGSTQAPIPDAFVIGGGSVKDGTTTRSVPWSALFLSQSMATRLIPANVLDPLRLQSTQYLMVSAYHPYASELLALVRTAGMRALYVPEIQSKPSVANLRRDPLTYSSALALGASSVVPLSTQEGFDFDAIAPYALYNWELFYFSPVFAAQRLVAASKFREAQAFYHFVFNPLTTDPDATRARYWITKPFRTAAVPDDIQSILESAAAAAPPKPNPWKVIEDRPFDPHAIAANRPGAYQKYVVKCYLDNLLAWGDALYRHGDREDIDEATPLYQLAQTILGDAPNEVRMLGRRPTRAFGTPDAWLGGSNLLVQLESLIQEVGETQDGEPVHLPLVTADAATGAKSLYFRIAPNAALLDYWKKVAQRLDNIRCCRTLDGGVAKLPLAAAPIDPQALADAAAFGLSVADAIAMASAAPPPYRFPQLLAKARERCEEVRALGNALLAALEKRDSEQLAATRSKFEQPILQSSRATKLAQGDQIQAEVAALESAKQVIVDRQQFYAGREYMNHLEKASFALGIVAGVLDTVGAVIELTSGGVQLIPDVVVGVSGFGGTPMATISYGGSTVSGSMSKFAKVLSIGAHVADRAASIIGTQAGYARRKEEWDHNVSQAGLELAHTDQQIAAARLRVAINEAELAGQDAQDAAWQQTDRLLREKFTNVELYDWNVQRLTEVYRRAYEQAVEMAGLARECLAFESGDATIARPGTSGWDRARSGLLAAEGLSQYLRDLDVRYQTHRMYDRLITQHVSLKYVAPLAFCQLLSSGSSTGELTIPGWWFKRLYPGVIRRRIRSLCVSIPCVTGAYGNVNATLTYTGKDRTPLSSISIGSGNADYGWDMSTRHEAYVPFEGISLDADTTWKLEFPAGKDIDVSAIADVVLTFEYTANIGADGADEPTPLQLFIDVPRMLPDVWGKLKTATPVTFDAADLLPTFLRGYAITDVKQQVVLDATGAARTGLIGCTVSTDAATQRKVISLATQTAGVPWDELRHLLVVSTVEKAP